MKRPVDELISEINSYLEKDRESLPVAQVELLENVIHHLQASKSENARQLPSLGDLAGVTWRFLDFLTDGAMLEKFKDLL